MKLKRFILLVFGILAMLPTYAQVSDAELAKAYFDDGEFEKAILYLEKLYENSPNTTFYSWYLESLIQTGDYKAAEKLVKKQQKRDTRNLFVFIDWAKIFEVQGDEKKAVSKYDELVENLEKNRGQTKRLADYLVSIKKPEIALALYSKAKELNNGGYGYEFEVATIKGTMGKYDEMIAAYLELLKINPSYLKSVRISLQRTLNFEENPEYAELIQEETLKKIQAYPELTIYNEFLIWLQLQQKDFLGAFYQAKSLDLRYQEGGQRIYEIAKLAFNNKDDVAAKKCCEYLLEQENSERYVKLEALNIKLQLEKKELLKTQQQAELANLSTSYFNIIDSLGFSDESVPFLLQYVDLQLSALNLPDTAEEMLLNALEVETAFSPVNQARLKITLADYYVLQNNVWEASLLYIQVEKRFKEDVIGHQAKLSNALVYYYTGDFEWSQSQLDVLKASTSKLISNDALELSLLITDNLALDTITEPLEMFARGDLLLKQNKYEAALQTYDSVLATYSGHSLSDEILLRKSEIAYENGDFNASSDYLSALIALDSTDILVDKALYLLAELNATELKQPEIAKTHYKTIITNYPNSLYAAEARKKFRALRGDIKQELP